MAICTPQAMEPTQQRWARLFSTPAWGVELATRWYAMNRNGACQEHPGWLWRPPICVLPIGRCPTTTADGAILLSSTSTLPCLPSSSSLHPLLELFLSSTNGKIFITCFLKTSLLNWGVLLLAEILKDSLHRSWGFQGPMESWPEQNWPSVL